MRGPMDTLSQEMFTALRRMGDHPVTSHDIGVNGYTLNQLAERGFLIADASAKPVIYGLSQMGHGAVAVLNGPVAPRESEGAIARIQRVVAHHYGIPLREMTSDRRFRAVARPRQVAMYLCRSLTPHSLPAIGLHFGGRDHTTVLHAIRTIEGLCQIKHGRLAQDVDALFVALGSDERVAA